MTISFIAASVDGTDVGEGGTATIPATAQVGDRLLAVLGSNDTGAYTHPIVDSNLQLPGWTYLETSYGSVDGGSQFATLYTKIVEVDDPGTQVMFTVSPTGTKEVVIIAAYRGTDTTPFINATSVLPLVSSGTAIPVGQVNVTETPAGLVTFATRKGGSAQITQTPPTGFTLRGDDWVDGGGAMVVAVADDETASSGATTVGDWSSTESSGAATAFLVALYEGPPPVQQAPVFRRWTLSGWFPAPA